MIDIKAESIYNPSRTATLQEIDEVTKTSSFKFSRKNNTWTATKNLK